MDGSFLYFAYGSNMLTERLLARCSSASFVDVGVLSDSGLDFSKRNDDGSGKATLTKSLGSTVYGVLFKIQWDQIDNLDAAEGAGFGYDRKMVTIGQSDDGQLVQAQTYVATDRDAALLPYDWYHGLVVAGAAQHRLPAEHQEKIGAFHTMVDPDPCRKSRMEALQILNDAGFAHQAEKLA